jgi:hypothetical protein
MSASGRFLTFSTLPPQRPLWVASGLPSMFRANRLGGQLDGSKGLRQARCYTVFGIVRLAGQHSSSTVAAEICGTACY